MVISIFLNLIITIVEVIGGIFSNSLALVSDAIHNLGDTTALILAWIAEKIGGKKPDARRTFGYKRLEILSAFINASGLTAISIYLMYEAIIRLLDPEPVRSGLMLIIAVTGLIVNLVSMLILHRGSKEKLNIKAAYLHLMGDTLSSVGVIAGAIMIYFIRVFWIDPALTLLISIVIIVQAYRILKESVNILMQSTPSRLDLQEIKEVLEKQPRIRNVHHIHCWQLQDHDVLFEAHIETLNDMTLSDCNQLRDAIEELLKDKFSITHTTLQFEFASCDNLEMIRQFRI